MPGFLKCRTDLCGLTKNGVNSQKHLQIARVTGKLRLRAKDPHLVKRPYLINYEELLTGKAL